MGVGAGGVVKVPPNKGVGGWKAPGACREGALNGSLYKAFYTFQNNNLLTPRHHSQHKVLYGARMK